MVEATGTISDNKGCNIPSGQLSLSVVTEKDAKDLELIAELAPEYVAASFVGTAADIEEVRSHLNKHGNFTTKIIAKIERPVALEVGGYLHSIALLFVNRRVSGVSVMSVLYV
jgi:pyruvate kinase